MRVDYKNRECGGRERKKWRGVRGVRGLISVQVF